MHDRAENDAVVNGACEALIDWPHAKRGPYYQSGREILEGTIQAKAK